MMKKRRLLTGILALTMVFSAMTSVVSALTFSDVEGDATVAWAKDSIHQMTEAGYIKGYEDGTYKPYRAISKLECLLLMARMLGAEEEDSAEFAAAAKETYTDTVSKYNTTYLGELTYLLYTGILTESDLIEYASAANANTALLRHQAAVLMAKMLGKNTEAKEYEATAASYGDDAIIPAASKAYVEFVTEEGIMNGMDKDANGKTQFSPITSLTRAQMATLLARMMDRIGKFTYTATIDALDLDNNRISMNQNGSVSARAINADTIARQDGTMIELDDLKAGAQVSAIEIGGRIQLIDVLDGGSQNNGTVVYAKISQLTESSGGKKITLADTENASHTTGYPVAADCAYVVKGAKAGFSDLKKGDFVKVIIRNEQIASVEVSSKELTIEGTLTAVDFDEEDHVYLSVLGADKDQQQYAVSNKGAKVQRDGETAEYRELSAGDKVTLSLTYGKVTEVIAVSTLEKFSGVLSEIIIAKKPSLTIVIDGEEKNYNLRSNAKIRISGVDATIYDLRPSVTVTGTLDGNEIKTLSASMVATNEKGEFTGEVVSINTTYKVISVMDESGNEQSIYYNSKTNMLKSSGTSASARDIQKGAILSVTGEEKNGVFEATIIIIK